MFDLSIIPIAADECGYEIVSTTDSRVDVRVGPLHVLCFENMTEDEDTIVFFEDGWHSHGDILSQIIGCEIHDVPEKILQALKKGQALLVRQAYANGTLELGLKFSNSLSLDSIKGLEPGEAIEYSRAV